MRARSPARAVLLGAGRGGGGRDRAITLEEVARLATLTTLIEPRGLVLDTALRRKHFERKHGPRAYYGQP